MRDIWRDMAARFEVTDEEYVRHVRELVTAYDRRNKLLQVYFVGGAIASLVGFIVLVQELQGPMQGGMRQGFLIGLLLGALGGGYVIKAAHFLLNALTPLRNERLLLQYHDALMELIQRPAEAYEIEEHLTNKRIVERANADAAAEHPHRE